MRIDYKVPDFPEPGDNDLSKGIEEINKRNYEIAQTHFEKSATYGNEYGQLFCGLIHYGGFDVLNRNPSKALEYFQAAEADWKNKIAQFFIGIMYLSGDGVALDEATSRKWIDKSAENDCILAKLLLTEKFSDVYQNFSQLFTYSKQIVESDLFNNNILCLFENINFKVNFDGCIIRYHISEVDRFFLYPDFLVLFTRITKTNEDNMWLLWYIISNNPYIISMSQLKIGTYYFAGVGIEKDHQKSLDYFYKSAKEQIPEAYYYIATQYAGGCGVEQNYIEANKNLLKAVSLGDIESLISLAFSYYLGRGIEQNIQTALSHYENYVNSEKALDKGVAYCIMGTIYLNTRDGIKQNYKKALGFFEKAWEYGIELGACNIADIYDRGLGVKKSRKSAIEWYSKAASSKCSIAYYKLGCIELREYKSKEDLDRALGYFRVAEEYGVAKARDMIDKITLLSFMNLRLSK